MVDVTTRQLVGHNAAGALRSEPRQSGGHSKPGRGGSSTYAAIFLACLGAGIWSSSAQAQAFSEYEVKAVFLYNFAKFVEWPPEASETSDPGFTFCVVGRDPFGDSLEQVVRGKSVNGRALKLRRVRAASQARTCQIAFISASERKRLQQILDSMSGVRVLTVGDTEGFVEQGGMINFALEEDRVRFEINLGAAERAGFKISSKLLSLAKIVRSEKLRRKD